MLASQPPSENGLGEGFRASLLRRPRETRLFASRARASPCARRGGRCVIHGRAHEPIAPLAILSRDSFPSRTLPRVPPSAPLARRALPASARPANRHPVIRQHAGAHPRSQHVRLPRRLLRRHVRRFAAPTAISSLRFAPSLDLPFPPRARRPSPRGVRASVPVRGRPPVARRDAFVSASDETPDPT